MTEELEAKIKARIASMRYEIADWEEHGKNDRIHQRFGEGKCAALKADAEFLESLLKE